MTVAGWSVRENAGVLHEPVAERDDARRLAQAAAIHAVRSERARMGCALHDTVCQELAGLALSAEAMAKRLRAGRPEEAARAAELAAGIREALGSVRATLDELMPLDVGADGLAAALQQLAQATERDYEVRCCARCRGSISDRELAQALFFIASEGVSNAARHACAAGIDVELHCTPDATRLIVRDDGVGMRGTGKDSRGKGGRGLSVMRRRAAAAGGVLTIQSTPGSGTTIRCEVIHDISHSDNHGSDGAACASQALARRPD